MAPGRYRLRRPPPHRDRLTPRAARAPHSPAWWRRVFDIRPSERPVVRAMVAYFFLLGALQHVLKPPRTSFFLDTAGSANLPWAYIGSAVFSTLAILAYGRWVAPLSRPRQILGTQILVAASLVVFFPLLQEPGPWISGAFYVWVQAFGVLLFSQFFILAQDMFDPRQAKRIYGVVGAGGLAGGVLGSAAAGFLANEIGSDNLLWIGVAFLGGSMALALRVFRVGRVHVREEARGGTKRSERMRGGLAVIRRVPHLRMIAALLFLGVLASTFVDWLYNDAVQIAHPLREDKTEFIGQSFAWFNGLAFVAQLFLVSAAMRYLGLIGALLVLPLVLGSGMAAFLVLPGLWTATVAKGVETGFKTSIDQSAREILYLPVPTPLVQRAKPFLDVVVVRLTDGVAGVLILLGFSAAFGPRGLAAATVVTILLWLGTVAGVRRTYRRSLERLLSVRDVDLTVAAGESLDSTSVRELFERLAPEVESDRVHYALDLLAGAPPGLLRDQAVALLRHPDATVRARAVDILARIAGTGEAELVRPLAQDPEPAVRARAALLLMRVDGNGRLSTMRPWLETEDEHLVEAALVGLLLHDDEDGREEAGRAIARLVRQVGEAGVPARTAVARALGRIPGRDPLHQHLETLLSDAHSRVVASAIASAGAVTRRDLVPALLPHLEARETRPAARQALAAYGDAGIPDLTAALRDPDLPLGVRRWLPGVFVAIGTRAAYRALLDGLRSVRVSKDRLYGLKALNKLRRRHPGWDLDRGVIRDELDRELLAAYESERRLANLTRAIEAREIPGATAGPLAGALSFEATRTVERAFRLQGLLYPPQTIYFAYAGLTSADKPYAAHALELLETALRREDAARIMPLIDPDVPLDRRVEIGRQWYPLAEQSVEEDLEDLLQQGEPWLQAYAVRLAGASFPAKLGPELERLAASGPPLVRPLARQALDKEGGDEVPLSAVDKAAALRRAELFSGLGADDLLQIAAVAEERGFEAGEHLFYEGEEGDYLYVVLDGRVRAERGRREVYVFGPGEAIGTFSILDREPRSADAVAIAPARTLALHRADLAQILADNYSLVEGLFGYLTRIIRRMNEREDARGVTRGIPE